jgi:hypothetical protein
MCLTTKQKWPKIAWKPITVYKVIYGYPNNYRTLYQRMPIDISKTYRESVYNILKNRKYLPQIEEKGYYALNEGLHSVKDRITALAIADYYEILYPIQIVKCTIPRFSLYWIGVDNDIVSNKLKYVKIL